LFFFVVVVVKIQIPEPHSRGDSDSVDLEWDQKSAFLNFKEFSCQWSLNSLDNTGLDGGTSLRAMTVISASFLASGSFGNWQWEWPGPSGDLTVSALTGRLTLPRDSQT
jgi:hypothetical protein